MTLRKRIQLGSWTPQLHIEKSIGAWFGFLTWDHFCMIIWWLHVKADYTEMCKYKIILNTWSQYGVKWLYHPQVVQWRTEYQCYIRCVKITYTCTHSKVRACVPSSVNWSVFGLFYSNLGYCDVSLRDFLQHTAWIRSSWQQSLKLESFRLATAIPLNAINFCLY